MGFVLCSVLAGVSMAQNVIGVTKVTLPANQYVMISTSFLNESNTVQGLFGDFPTGSEVVFWNADQQQYVSVTKTRAGWGTSGTNSIIRGTGAFLSTPQATNLFVAGDVPDDGTSTIYVANGYALLSYPYPANIAFTNTTLATSALTGDAVSFWDNGWSTFTKTRAGWVGTTNVQLRSGQAFFYQSTTDASRTEPQPY